MKRHIKKVAVLGSGVMGSRIACHFANIGLNVLLLDIVPRELNDKEKAKGLSLEDKAVRNRIVNDSLTAAIKSNPSPIYSKRFIDRIETGNFDDDMSGISECDWIIEVVIERLDIKKQVFDNVEKHRKPGTLITTNTSGIPINHLLDGRSEDFAKHFCGTHFFNPPRYLRLFEVIPSKKTDPEVIDFLMEYGEKYLGKKSVLCKDTPAFIANRIGVYSIQALLHLVEEMDMKVEEVDKLTGPVMGRPKSATFRTADVVGLDTMVHVANGVRENCPNDEENATFIIPDYLQKMVDNKWLGSKTKQGFYKKVKGEDGKSQILALDLATLEYREQTKPRFDTIKTAREEDDLRSRTKILFKGKDKAGEFYRKIFSGMFKYVSHRVPEITDDIYKVDDALKAGFGYELGPFETWDAIGVKKALEVMEELGKKPAAWVYEMLEAGNESFFKLDNGIRSYYDQASKSYKIIPGQESTINLDYIPEDKVVWKNKGTTIKDLGDGILNLEFHTKMNTIGGEVLQGLNKAMDLAESEYEGLIISNQGQNFSAGANVGMIFMLAVEQEAEEIDMAVRMFQNTMMRLRYSSCPVIVAPHNLCLGGGCEMAMHSDKVIAHAETYMGLVEFGVGVIPGGGGTKEFALRLSDELDEGDIRTNSLRNRFLTVGQAKVSTSGEEAFELGYLRKGIDEVIVNRERQLAYAKQSALTMLAKGYVAPSPRKDITVLGKEGLGIVYVGANSMESGHYITEHEKLLSEKLGYALCGGALSERTKVSEQYLLDLERKTFVELAMTRKSMERMQSIITTGKVLRN
ncbi:MAG: 3-hydroxyacyl-CoA dehydrogenase [Flavobacteriales bacterium]|nr:3-hydroxyacyl-CoA dehydrogenase [Flavobacteriales bacterium]